MAKKLQPAREKRFDFEGKVKPHLKTLPDYKARLMYLYEVKAEYDQTIGTIWDFLDKPSFSKQCESEIQKIKLQMDLEKPSKNQSDSSSESEANKRNSEFTTARQVLAVYCLLKHLKVFEKADKTEVARFIQFLTSKSYDGIYKNVLAPFKLKDSEAMKDLNFVKGYFEKLKLTELVEEFERDMKA